MSAEQVCPALTLSDCINDTCPWSGKPVSSDSLTSYRDQNGKRVVVGFCNPSCRDKFDRATKFFDARLNL